MTSVRVRLLTCDKPLCSARYFNGTRRTPATVLRHQAQAAGWTTNGDQDFCPAHEPWPGFAAWATAPETEVPG